MKRRGIAGPKSGWALALCSIVSGCAYVADPGAETPLDPNTAALDAIAGTIEYPVTGTSAGRMAIDLADGDIAVISRNGDGLVTVNDVIVAGAYVAVVPRGATGIKVRSITIRSPSSGTADEQVIVDFSTGAFALGAAGSPGIDIDLTGGTGDKITVRGQDSASPIDNFRVGASGILYGTTPTLDTVRDIAFAGVESLQFLLLAGDDIFSAEGGTGVGAASSVAVHVLGGEGNDTLRGGAGDDRLEGGAGNDVFWTAAETDGADVYVGGLGTDTMSYSGKPTVAPSTNLVATRVAVGARTNDLVVELEAEAGGSDDDGEAGEGDDVRDDVEVLLGGAGDDTLTMGTGANTAYGGEGDDTLAGGAGADVLYGEGGDDTFDEGAAATGGDVFHGGLGHDVLDYSARSAAVTVTADGVAANDGAMSEGDDARADVEEIVGGDGNDVIAGGAFANVLRGGDGTDTLRGLGGADTLYGDAGNDTLEGGDGDDVFDEGDDANGGDSFAGGAGVDAVTYAARSASVTVSVDGVANDGQGESDNVGSDVERLVGGSGDDTLTGGAGHETLEGGPGADTLSGGAGDDILEGGAGTDDLDCGDGVDFCFDSAGDCSAALSCEL
jgi:Ca2+-binding RTX toxin-like protein